MHMEQGIIFNNTSTNQNFISDIDCYVIRICIDLQYQKTYFYEQHIIFISLKLQTIHEIAEINKHNQLIALKFQLDSYNRKAKRI